MPPVLRNSQGSTAVGSTTNCCSTTLTASNSTAVVEFTHSSHPILLLYDKTFVMASSQQRYSTGQLDTRNELPRVRRAKRDVSLHDRRTAAAPRHHRLPTAGSSNHIHVRYMIPRDEKKSWDHQLTCEQPTLQRRWVGSTIWAHYFHHLSYAFGSEIVVYTANCLSWLCGFRTVFGMFTVSLVICFGFRIRFLCLHERVGCHVGFDVCSQPHLACLMFAVSCIGFAVWYALLSSTRVSSSVVSARLICLVLCRSRLRPCPSQQHPTCFCAHNRLVVLAIVISRIIRFQYIFHL